MNQISPTIMQSLRGFMPPGRIITAGAHKTPNVLIDPDHFKGMVEHEYTHTSLTLNCYLEYEEGFDGGSGPNSEESYPERISLCYALANGIDVLCVLGEDLVSDIEAEALAAMATDAFEDAYDRAADRYEERMAA